MADKLRPRQILLAEDDKDDILLFFEVFKQLSLPGKITSVQDGEALMKLLDDEQSRPDILFLDLNMPRKNGLDCLAAIKRKKKLRLPVIIFSTTYEDAVVNQSYANGAQYYIRKPNDFGVLKQVIAQVLALTSAIKLTQPPRGKFVLSS